jgi:hypothetical protein
MVSRLDLNSENINAGYTSMIWKDRECSKAQMFRYFVLSEEISRRQCERMRLSVNTCS